MSGHPSTSATPTPTTKGPMTGSSIHVPNDQQPLADDRASQ